MAHCFIIKTFDFDLSVIKRTLYIQTKTAEVYGSKTNIWLIVYCSDIWVLILILVLKLSHQWVVVLNILWDTNQCINKIHLDLEIWPMAFCQYQSISLGQKIWINSKWTLIGQWFWEQGKLLFIPPSAKQHQWG